MSNFMVLIHDDGFMSSKNVIFGTRKRKGKRRNTQEDSSSVFTSHYGSNEDEERQQLREFGRISSLHHNPSSKFAVS